MAARPPRRSSRRGRAASPRGRRSRGSIHDVDEHALAVAHGGGLDDGAQRGDGAPAAADHLAGVVIGDAAAPARSCRRPPRTTRPLTSSGWSTSDRARYSSSSSTTSRSASRSAGSAGASASARLGRGASASGLRPRRLGSASSAAGAGLRRATPASAVVRRSCVRLHQLLHRVGRLGAARDPVLEALLVDRDRRGLRLRVVVADRLDEAAIARRALVGDDHAPDRILLAAHAGEPDSYGHRVGRG